MKNHIIPILLILWGLSGCATAPPPKITDTTYENYEYEFGINIPAGWKSVNIKDVNNFLYPNSSPFHTMKAAFTNHATESTMLLNYEKSIINPDILVFAKDEELRQNYIDHFEQAITKIKTSSSQDMDVQDVNYEIKKVKCYEGPCLMSTLHLDLKAKKKNIDNFTFDMESYQYRCNNDDTCSVQFMMISKPDYIQRSQKELKLFTKSLRRGVGVSKTFFSYRAPSVGESSYPDKWLLRSTGHEKILLGKHISITYDYKIENDVILFDGNIFCNPKNEEVGGWNNATITLDVFFTNKENTVISAYNYKLPNQKDFCISPIPFKEQYPFPYDGRTGVGFAYNIEVWQ